VSVDLEALYDDHAARVGGFIRRLTGEGPHVDDLLQETFMTAHKRRSDLANVRDPSLWLYGVARNLCRHHWRSERRLLDFLSRLAHESPKGTSSADKQLAQAEDALLVRRAVEALPYKQREVFVLYELEDWKGEEIAELLEVPIGTVWTRLRDARGNFEKRLQRRLAEVA
jgi:RNA polymerase sigma-70 factor, ECF subfamily